MDCFNLNISDLGDKNFIFPIIGLCGLCMTYFGNKFVRPTIFSLGTILSIEPNYLLKINNAETKYKKILLIGDQCFRG